MLRLYQATGRMSIVHRRTGVLTGAACPSTVTLSWRIGVERSGVSRPVVRERFPCYDRPHDK
jgi:hypothetical protein